MTIIKPDANWTPPRPWWWGGLPMLPAGYSWDHDFPTPAVRYVDLHLSYSNGVFRLSVDSSETQLDAILIDDEVTEALSTTYKRWR